MSDIIPEHNLFRPKPSKAETKADITNNVARAIIGEEVERRDAKTARLRLARLAAEAKLAASSAPANKPRLAKSVASRRP